MNEVCWWFEIFRSGDFNLENELHGRPETKVDNDELKASRSEYISNYA